MTIFILKFKIVVYRIEYLVIRKKINTIIIRVLFWI